MLWLYLFPQVWQKIFSFIAAMTDWRVGTRSLSNRELDCDVISENVPLCAVWETRSVVILHMDVRGKISWHTTLLFRATTKCEEKGYWLLVFVAKLTMIATFRFGFCFDFHFVQFAGFWERVICHRKGSTSSFQNQFEEARTQVQPVFFISSFWTNL